MERGVEAAPKESARFEFRRKVYLLSAPPGIAAVLSASFARAGQDAFAAVAYPLLALCCTAVLLALWRRRLTVAAADRIMIVALSAAFTAQLAYGFHRPIPLPELQNYVNHPTFIAVTIVFALMHLAMANRTALIAACALYTAVAATILVRVVPEFISGPHRAEALEYLTTVGTLGLALVLLHTLASFKEQLARTDRLARTMSSLAHTDTLTGLPNRRHLEQAITSHIYNLSEHGIPFSLVLVDIDHFKDVNDVHGHETGDVILRLIAERLDAAVREDDLVGRWGGEEFLVLAPMATTAQAQRLADRCREQLSRTDYPPAGTITASFGVTAAVAEDTRSALLRRADEAVYTAKQAGRDRVETIVAGHGTDPAGGHQ